MDAMSKLPIKHVVALQCLIDGNMRLPRSACAAVAAARDAHLEDHSYDDYLGYEEGRGASIKPTPSEMRAARQCAEMLNARSVTFDGDLT
jgi:hypothetical protein